MIFIWKRCWSPLDISNWGWPTLCFFYGSVLTWRIQQPLRYAKSLPLRYKGRNSHIDMADETKTLAWLSKFSHHLILLRALHVRWLLHLSCFLLVILQARNRFTCCTSLSNQSIFSHVACRIQRLTLIWEFWPYFTDFFRPPSIGPYRENNGVPHTQIMFFAYSMMATSLPVRLSKSTSHWCQTPFSTFSAGS